MWKLHESDLTSDVFPTLIRNLILFPQHGEAEEDQEEEKEAEEEEKARAITKRHYEQRRDKGSPNG